MRKSTFDNLLTLSWWVWAVVLISASVIGFFVGTSDWGITAAGVACLAMATKEDKK